MNQKKKFGFQITNLKSDSAFQECSFVDAHFVDDVNVSFTYVLLRYPEGAPPGSVFENEKVRRLNSSYTEIFTP